MSGPVWADPLDNDLRGGRAMTDVTCSAWDCDRPAKARGWCFKHYHRVMRHGDPSVRIKGDGISSQAVHLRLRRAKGKASLYSCTIAWCEKQAEDWAYDHTDPDPLLGKIPQSGKLFEYSADLDRYMPLCKFHHHHLDRSLHCSYD